MRFNKPEFISVSTNNDSPTFALPTIPMPSGVGVILKVEAIARDVNGNYAYWDKRHVVQNVAGTPTIAIDSVDVINPYKGTGLTDLDITFSYAEGDVVIVDLKGLTMGDDDLTINWDLSFQYGYF